MNRISMGGYQFDLGPSIVMMPELYREVFELTGRDPDDYIPMQKLDPMYSTYFGANAEEKYDISSDLVELMKMESQWIYAMPVITLAGIASTIIQQQRDCRRC